MARRSEHWTEGRLLDEAHGPGGSCRCAPELLVYEVREASKSQPERHAAGHVIMDAQPVQLLLAGEVEDAERSADHAPVERHAAVPQLQDFDRVLQILAEIVEEHVAETTAKDDPQRGVENQVIGMSPRHRSAGLLQ